MDDEVDLWIAVIAKAIEDANYRGDNHGRNCYPTRKQVAEAKAFLRNEDGYLSEICRWLRLDIHDVWKKNQLFSEKCMAGNQHIGL